MAVRNAASCGLPIRAVPDARGAETASEKLKHHKQKDADDAGSKRHHFDRPVDRIAHRVGWGLMRHCYKGVTNITNYVPFARGESKIFGGGKIPLIFTPAD